MFCDTCSTIEFTWPTPVGSNASAETLWDEDGNYIFHTYSSMKDLVASFQRGCILCTQIAAAFVGNIYAKKSSPVHLVWSIRDKDKAPPLFRAMLDEEPTRPMLYWESFRIITVDGMFSMTVRRLTGTPALNRLQSSWLIFCGIKPSWATQTQRVRQISD
jgi:hypothetical protein